MQRSAMTVVHRSRWSPARQYQCGRKLAERNKREDSHTAQVARQRSARTARIAGRDHKESILPAENRINMDPLFLRIAHLYVGREPGERPEQRSFGARGIALKTTRL